MLPSSVKVFCTVKVQNKNHTNTGYANTWAKVMLLSLVGGRSVHGSNYLVFIEGTSNKPEAGGKGGYVDLFFSAGKSYGYHSLNPEAGKKSPSCAA